MPVGRFLCPDNWTISFFGEDIFGIFVEISSQFNKKFLRLEMVYSRYKTHNVQGTRQNISSHSPP
jgi:hypothetical protein